MNDPQKRQYVANLYPGPGWHRRVSKMPDSQVIAIYLKHISDGLPPAAATDPHMDLPPRPPHENENHFH